MLFRMAPNLEDRKPTPPLFPRLASNAELLAALVDTGKTAANAERQAEDLLRLHGGLGPLFRSLDYQGRGEAAWQRRLASARELCRRRLLERLDRGAALTSPDEVTRFLCLQLQDRRREVFTVLFLDTRHRVVAVEDLFRGSIDGACVYPRVVAERALLLGAAAVIVAHNHPSGVAEPSIADQAITRRLRDALALLEVRLLDHFIIGEGGAVSMAGRGLV